MRTVRVMLGALTMMMAVQVAAAPPPTPASVRRDIAKHGAKAVVDRMWIAGSWGRLEDGIASGSPAWIRLAPLLSGGTDAGTAEGLSQSLIRALPKSPEPVLAVIDVSGHSYPRSPGQVCSAGFIEGDRTEFSATGLRRSPRSLASTIARWR